MDQNTQPVGRTSSVLSEQGDTAVLEPRRHPPQALRVKAHRPPGSAFKRFFAFLGWVFTGFGLIPALLRATTGQGAKQEITIYSAHRAFNLWALIMTGFVGSWVVARWPHGKAPQVVGWIYIWVMIYTFITLLFDFGTIKLLIWAGLFTLIWVSSKYIEKVKGVPVLTGLFGYFRYLKPELNHGFAVVMSWLLLVPWIGALFLTFTNGRKRFTPNEITEWYIGEGSELLDRSGLKFRTRYRDILEMVLGFGAGDLIAFDNRQVVVKRFENVLFLVFLWPKLDALLQERQTIVDTAPGDPLHVAETDHAHAVEHARPAE